MLVMKKPFPKSGKGFKRSLGWDARRKEAAAF
jgi:hypothetical protein